MNREERRALKLIITDRVEQETAKENERRRKEKERLESEHEILLQNLFHDGECGGRIRFDTPEVHWSNDGILQAQANLKLTASGRKRIKDSKKKISSVGDAIVSTRSAIDLVMAETVLTNKADALKKVDAIVKEIMKRLINPKNPFN
jgi:hypothetical protein